MCLPPLFAPKWSLSENISVWKFYKLINVIMSCFLLNLDLLVQPFPVMLASWADVVEQFRDEYNSDFVIPKLIIQCYIKWQQHSRGLHFPFEPSCKSDSVDIDDPIEDVGSPYYDPQLQNKGDKEPERVSHVIPASEKIISKAEQ